MIKHSRKAYKTNRKTHGKSQKVKKINSNIIEFFLCRPTHNKNITRGFHIKNISTTQFEITFNYTNSNHDEHIPDINEYYGGFCYNMAEKRNNTHVIININPNSNLDYYKVYHGFKSAFTPDIRKFTGQLGEILEPSIILLPSQKNINSQQQNIYQNIDILYKAIYFARLLINLPPNIKTFNQIVKLIKEYIKKYIKKYIYL